MVVKPSRLAKLNFTVRVPQAQSRDCVHQKPALGTTLIPGSLRIDRWVMAFLVSLATSHLSVAFDIFCSMRPSLQR